jgi:DNA-binding transcriptional ArsR family regulator
MTDIFDVIADGTRRDILQLLLRRAEEGDAGTSVGQIVAELGISQPTVSKHLKVLREAELVNVREDGQRRFYSLSVEPLSVVDDWLVPFLVDAYGDAAPTSPTCRSRCPTVLRTLPRSSVAPRHRPSTSSRTPSSASAAEGRGGSAAFAMMW